MESLDHLKPKVPLTPAVHCVSNVMRETIDRMRQAVIHTRQKLNTSELRLCLVLGLPRSSLRYRVMSKNDDDLRFAMPRLSKQYERYCYRKFALVAPLVRATNGRNTFVHEGLAF